MERIEDGHGCHAYLAGDILVFHHVEAISLATVEVVERARAKALAKRRLRGAIVVMEASLPPPEAAARARLAQVMKSNEGIVGAAFVFRSEGFAGAALRAALTGISLLVRMSYPTKVFGTVREAALWLSRLGAASTGDGAALAVESSRV